MMGHNTLKFSEKGNGLVEYTLVVVLIIGAAVGAVKYLGVEVSEVPCPVSATFAAGAGSVNGGHTGTTGPDGCIVEEPMGGEE